MTRGQAHNRCGFDVSIDHHRRGERAAASSARSSSGVSTVNWTVVAAITWALLFASLHLAWAAGSRVLLVDTAEADAAFGQLPFQIYNAFVVLVSVAAAGLAFASARGATLGRHRWQVWVWLPAGILTIRGTIGVIQLAQALLRSGDDSTWGAWSVDLYMLLGGVIFTLVAWRCAPPRVAKPKRRRMGIEPTQAGGAGGWVEMAPGTWADPPTRSNAERRRMGIEPTHRG
jgi:hypothetical protein